MAPFAIHPQLLLDAHFISTLAKSRVLLHKNAALPWFILVPETEVADLLDLPGDLLAAVMEEAKLIASFVKQTFGCPKINFAGIGNIVPQLHLHIVGRKPDDPCWPAPVWGNLREGSEYSSAELGRIVEQLQLHAPARFVVR
jgi:diadenosine tetraphosphate (Ap4A) HIT family hydrolase